MTTKDVIQGYFESLKRKEGWEAFESHVAEVFKVRDGKIESFDIYFDCAPFPK